MKVIILAGGYGSRLAELTEKIPKPMVPVGNMPILWHIMNIYASHGVNDFVIACGYKGEIIKQYFHNFHIKNSDYVVNLRTGESEFIDSYAPDWNVAPVDTGLDTMTGGRVLRLKDHVGDGTFMVTYGDGVGNVDLTALLDFHRSHGKLATVTAVRPPSRFGALNIVESRVDSFSEKPQTGGGWINGGFFVFEPEVFDYLDDDETVLERDPLESLVNDGELMAFEHDGFWQPMDTLREKRLLDRLWSSGEAPWKTWSD